MLNRVTLIGRISRKPTLEYTKNDTAVLKMSIACNEYNPSHKSVETCFFNIIYYGKSAEYVYMNADVGTLVSIDGKLRSRAVPSTNSARNSIVMYVDIVASTQTGVQILADKHVMKQPTQEELDAERDF